MVNSVAKNLPGVKVHAYLVNMTDEQGKMLKLIHPSLEYTIENVRFDFSLQRKCYCTNRRSYILNELRKKTNDILIWMDADSIIVRECPDLLDFARKCDVSYRPKNESDLTKFAKRKKRVPKGFMAGVIIVGNSKNAAKFTNLYDEKLKQSSYKKAKLNYGGSIFKLPPKLKKIWMSNQDLLNDVHKILEKEINFVPLPQKYLDCVFGDDTAIWSIKASNRKDRGFNKKFKSYRVSTKDLEKQLSDN
jgi:hypothetical protein